MNTHKCYRVVSKGFACQEELRAHNELLKSLQYPMHSTSIGRTTQNFNIICINTQKSSLLYTITVRHHCPTMFLVYPFIHAHQLVLLMDECVGLPQRDSPSGYVRAVRLVHHADAVDDRADRHAQRTPGTVRRHVGKMRLGVKGDRLVARVVADHVALATVDAHVLVDDGHHLLRVVQLTVGPDGRQGSANHILGREGPGRGR